jgi:FkbM family methyltransferase
MQNIPEQLLFINNDLWWHNDNINEYEYQLKTNNDFMKKITPHLKGNDIAIQAGGSCGWLVRQIQPHFKHIYTFEPNYLSFLCLCLNLPFSNVSKFNACIGNERKLVKMSHHYDKLSSSGYVNGEGYIPTLLIDDLNVDKCDFMQLDLEGFEYNALLGARKTIEKFKPVLCIEHCWQFRYGASSEVMENLIIKEWGYKMVETIGPDRIYRHDNHHRIINHCADTTSVF